ncbi:hypothetical protein [Lederbergia panacisoli]|uniref:hypothetical protein n=1 Tax=Lederbergia panacisoli TaxID=1255251 RepID=UPI00214A9943|nr:hypothetical protein [Lederbergia panacisoli]MCR2820054.1 hypothetical protein [Lederbergia panacisoli]
MKRKISIGLLLIIFIIVLSFYTFKYLSNTNNPNLLSNLEGTIYFIERIDGTLTLFKSDAALKNKTLLYSHKGKGKDSLGGYNDNIWGFHYDQTNKTISFIAMDNGSWSLFSLKEGEEKPTLLQKDVMEISTDYIQDQSENVSVISRKGSLYLLEDGKEKTIKKFYGIYDSKFTGYRPIGLSPDGKYLIYFSMEHATPIGAIFEGLVKDSVGNMYIMDLSTLESTKYVNAYQIQWIMD